MILETYAATTPDKAAAIGASDGEILTYKQLNAASNKFARLLASRGLGPGDHVAFLVENCPRYFELVWAAQRSGLYFTPLSWHLRPTELAAIVEDCGAKVLVTSARMSELGAHVVASAKGLEAALMIGATTEGFESYEVATASFSDEPVELELEGSAMLYSSGSTGRPKGIRLPLSKGESGRPDPVGDLLSDLHGIDEDTVHLLTAPLYHSGPLGFSMRVQKRGGTVVVMDRFDAEDALSLVERYHVTHSQWVPTMLIRLLRLPLNVRDRFDLSSLRVVLHAAAPCPANVKQEVIDWLGPIVYEFYGGTERNGLTHIDSYEWLEHRGSVGRPVYGGVHILDESGAELPAGQSGTVYFSGGPDFVYENDPAGTRATRSPQGWTTLGDVGHLDNDGYLYLTDRRDFMIVSGGVNVFPQEAENALLGHPEVMDAAVVGISDDEYGEVLLAVVQPCEAEDQTDALAQRLIAHCRTSLPTLRCPRTVVFVDALPRSPAGKIDKSALRRAHDPKAALVTMQPD